MNRKNVCRHFSVVFATVALLLAATSARGTAQVSHDRMHDYEVSLVGPGALVSIGLTAAYDQSRNDPAVWGKTGSGFGKRVASAAGARFANETVKHSFAAVLDRSTGYTRCSCTSFGSRFGHAVISAITDTNASGKRMISEPAIAGAVAGAYAPRIWRPDYSASRAAAGIGISLGFSALGNVVSEFILH